VALAPQPRQALRPLGIVTTEAERRPTVGSTRLGDRI